MNINSLPNDCLGLILENFQFSELLHLRAVCPTWKVFIETTFFNPKHALNLFTTQANFNNHNQTLINYNVLEQANFFFGHHTNNLIIKPSSESRILEFLPELFPKLNQLLFHAKSIRPESIELFTGLLQKWPNLVNLTLMAPSWTLQPEVYQLIATQQSLERLNLFYMYRQKIPQNLPILPQLKEFVITHYIENLPTILEQLSPKLQKMLLGWVHLDATNFEQLILQDKNRFQNLTSFSLGYIYTNAQNRVKNFYKIIQLSCNHFTELTFFNIMYADNLPLANLLPELVKLPKLRELWLYIGSNKISVQFRALPAYTLPSIRILNLEIHQISVTQFESSIVPLFPKIKKLTLKCDYENAEIRKELREKCFKAFSDLECFKFKF